MCPAKFIHPSCVLQDSNKKNNAKATLPPRCCLPRREGHTFAQAIIRNPADPSRFRQNASRPAHKPISGMQSDSDSSDPILQNFHKMQPPYRRRENFFLPSTTSAKKILDILSN
jgi:hypothetical protein